jgi:hypothetical protein
LKFPPSTDCSSCIDSFRQTATDDGEPAANTCTPAASMAAASAASVAAATAASTALAAVDSGEDIQSSDAASNGNGI